MRDVLKCQIPIPELIIVDSEEIVAVRLGESCKKAHMEPNACKEEFFDHRFSIFFTDMIISIDPKNQNFSIFFEFARVSI